MNATPQEKEIPTSVPLGASPSVSDAVERLLAHPDLLATIASTLGLKAPAQEAQEVASAPSDPLAAAPSTPVPSPSPDLSQAMATIAPLLSAFSGKGNLGARATDPRSCLLRALKPYVSHNRAQAIDTILQLSAISEAFRGLNEKGG